MACSISSFASPGRSGPASLLLLVALLQACTIEDRTPTGSRKDQAEIQRLIYAYHRSAAADPSGDPSPGDDARSACRPATGGRPGGGVGDGAPARARGRRGAGALRPPPEWPGVARRECRRRVGADTRGPTAQRHRERIAGRCPLRSRACHRRRRGPAAQLGCTAGRDGRVRRGDAAHPVARPRPLPCGCTSRTRRRSCASAAAGAWAAGRGCPGSTSCRRWPPARSAWPWCTTARPWACSRCMGPRPRPASCCASWRTCCRRSWRRSSCRKTWPTRSRRSHARSRSSGASPRSSSTACRSACTWWIATTASRCGTASARPARRASRAPRRWAAASSRC